MKNKLIKGDILNVQQGIICHQVNCMGKMGAGIALSIRKKWPSVYQDYIAAYDKGQLQLGNVLLSPVVIAQLYVANLCGQYRYGRDKRYTDYGALETCLKRVREMGERLNLTVFVPYKMGCSLAGGDWKVVEDMINKAVPTSIIVKLD